MSVRGSVSRLIGRAWMATSCFSGFWAATPAPAAEQHAMQQVAAQGEWKLFCPAGSASTPHAGCAAAAYVKADNADDAWVKIALQFLVGTNVPTLEIATPGTIQTRDGVALGVDGRQIGRLPIDGCDKSSCRAHVNLDQRLMPDLHGSALDVEYQVDGEHGVRFPIALAGLRTYLDAAGYRQAPPAAVAQVVREGATVPVKPPLADVDMPAAGLGKANDVLGSAKDWLGAGYVQFRVPTSDPRGTQDARYRSVQDCAGALAARAVIVDDHGKVVDGGNLVSWVKDTNTCSGGATIWVTPVKGSGGEVRTDDALAGSPQERKAVSSIYDLISTIPGTKVLATDTNGVVTSRTDGLGLPTSR